jgi:hypothetical protein
MGKQSKNPFYSVIQHFPKSDTPSGNKDEEGDAEDEDGGADGHPPQQIVSRPHALNGIFKPTQHFC